MDHVTHGFGIGSDALITIAEIEIALSDNLVDLAKTIIEDQAKEDRFDEENF